MSFDQEQASYYTFTPHHSLTPVVKGLIIATIGGFVLQFVFRGFFRLELEHYLGLDPTALIRKLRIWQLVTYGFLHSPDLWHIILNLLFLYWFGRDVELALGRKRFLVFYLTAIVVAGIAFCVANALSPVGYVIGASGAIMAIMVVYAIYWPNRTVLFFFLFPMKIRTLVILMVSLDAYSAVTAAGGNVAHLAHLGGAAYGYIFIKFGPSLTKMIKGSAERNRREEQTRLRKEGEILDNILQKVHQQGMHKLNRWEKKFLLRESKKRKTPGRR